MLEDMVLRRICEYQGGGSKGKRVEIIFVLINPLNAKLNPICHLLALLGAHNILHISRIRVKNN